MAERPDADTRSYARDREREVLGFPVEHDGDVFWRRDRPMAKAPVPTMTDSVGSHEQLFYIKEAIAIRMFSVRSYALATQSGQSDYTI